MLGELYILKGALETFAQIGAAFRAQLLFFYLYNSLKLLKHIINNSLNSFVKIYLFVRFKGARCKCVLIRFFKIKYII